jgi:hypothetical protein
MALVMLVAAVAAAPAWAAEEPLWRESPGAAPPPDIARLNDFMNGLAERSSPRSSRCGGAPSPRPRARAQTPERRARPGFLIRQDG